MFVVMNNNAGSVFGKRDELQLLEDRNFLQKRPFYYPSNDIAVDSKLDKIAKSTSANNPRDKNIITDNLTKPSEIVQPIFSPSNLQNNIQEFSSGSSKYNESWDTHDVTLSHHVSVPSRNDLDDISIKHLIGNNSREHSIEDFLENNHGGVENSKGTIAKFVERFRNEPPQPRSERNHVKKEFWWLRRHLDSPPEKPSSSSTPLSDQSNNEINHYKLSYTSSNNMDSQSITPVKKGKENISPVIDSDIERIQQRASKLLELSSETSGGSLSTTTENTSQKQTKNPYKSSFPSSSVFPRELSAATDNILGTNTDNALMSRGNKKSLTPENDILYQWRLTRKMELAKLNQKPNPFLNRDTNLLIEKSNNESANRVENNFHKNQRNDDNDENEKNKEDIENKSIPPSKVNNEIDNELSINLNKICDFCLNNQLANSSVRNRCSCGTNCINHHSTNYVIQPHVHDICDIIPCVHGNKNNLLRLDHSLNAPQYSNKDELVVAERTNKRDRNNLIQNQQYESSNDKVLDDKLFKKNSSKGHIDKLERSLSTVKNFETSSEQKTTCYNVNPVIHEVVSDYLFDSHQDRDANENQGNLKYISDEEFTDDDILQELRKRREFVEDKLKAIDALLSRS